MDDCVRIMTPSGMLGSGWPEATIERGLALGVDVITVDGGSTDSGPYYLGSATAKTSAQAVTRDLRSLLTAAARAGVPLVIGSCGTSGTDAGVDWVAGLAAQVLEEEGLDLKVARIYSEQDAADLKEHLDAGRIHALPPLGELRVETLESCEHIVAMMGAEPIIAALRDGAQVVLAGRATDAGVAAAVPLLRGMPAGPSWHAGKIAECGGQATANPRTGGVHITVDAGGFTIEALDADTACTVQTVSAHMLYETVNPFRMREPAGTLDVSDATYTAIDERRVRVEGSQFHEAEQHTVKLEGSRITGYETMLFAGVRDPLILADVEGWADALLAYVQASVGSLLGLTDDDFAVDVRLYGHNAVLGAHEPDRSPPREVGVMMLISAPDQATATAVAKIANPPLLHFPAAGMDYFPSTAFATSPAHVERGAAYEFVLNHVVDTATPTDLFRIEHGVTRDA